ncbi:MAG TPA: beta-ketoacyl synthase N-terminal-like domain-containing protein, partial [Gemmataceae bacterium]|nr:beta-ketoacyl synthase N-terminal-like domain-containing protein [Gemmataceae bacterium]
MNDQSSSTPIAIIGMGCMFPKARDLQGYWTNILGRVDAITDVPGTHWRPEDYFDKDPKSPDRVYAARGGFLSPIDFPPLDFGITPNALEAIDTTQLLGLMVAREALEDAGYGAGRDFDRSRVSVILGVTGTLELVIPLGARLGHPIWRKALAQAGVEDSVAENVVQRIANSYVGWQEDSFPGLLGNVAAGRIANRLDLGGTNCVVDAACASSLSALHLATLELASGRCDMALSGGLDTFNDIFMYMCFSKTPALSPTGNARPFDTKADGTILGEGLGVLVLKRLADAEKDGDKIYAVIKAIGSSSDGKGNAIYAPNPAGQAKALRRAYQMASVTPDTVELVEAHGTGTRAGDAAELSALKEVFQESRPETQEPWCAFGSVKSQIGHTKAAAGAAGLIKAALALHHRVLPPTIKVDEPAEVAASGPLYINIEKRPWLGRRDHPRRAGVSSFGFGGSNFHCVLEEYPLRKPEINWDGSVQILPFSAKTREELADFLTRFPTDITWEQLRHEAWGLREKFDVTHPFRLLMVVEKEKTNLARLTANARTMLHKHATEKHWSTPDGLYFGSGGPGKLAFLFPGQGSQYLGMFRDLACQFPQMQEALAEANAAWRNSNEKCKNGINGSGKTSQGSEHSLNLEQLSDFIYPRAAFDDAARSKHEEALRNTAVAQPAIGAVSLGALRILEYFGVQPEAVAGHSYGEFVALHAAGRFDAATLQSLSILRGRLMAGASDGADLGAMLAVRGSFDVVQKILEKEGLDLTVANKNAPQQYVLSGASGEIDRAAGILAGMNIESKNLPVSAAFHSRFVAGVRQPLLSAMEKTAWGRSSIPIFANTTGTEYPHDDHSARRLLAGQLAEPVEFVTEIENMHASGARTFLEVGPSNKLTGLINAILGEKDHWAFALDASSGKQSGCYDLARALAALTASGHAVDLARWDPDGSKPPRPKPALTVPICGANYVKSRNEGAADGRSKMGGKRSENNNGRKDVAMNDANPQPFVRENSTPTVVKPAISTRTSQSMPQKGLPGHASPDDPAFIQALRNTQENLLALQRLSEQTAQVHRQFLEGQDKALQVFRDLLQQQQELISADLTPPLPDSMKVETRTPPARPTPFVAPTIAAPPEPPTPEPIAGPPKEPITSPPTSPDISPLKNVLLEVVAEKTGYPAEMLDWEMELDSDLGIDSIKRVEIFSALQERLPHAPAVKSEHLGTLRTLRQVVDFLSAPPDSTATVRPASDIPKTGDQTVSSDSQTRVSGPPPVEISSILLQVVLEKTGYPPEMLEPDMELDSDLGIDSIKRVEIFSALQERLPEAPHVKSDHLGSLRTLRQVVEFLGGEQASSLPEKLDVQPQIERLENG